MNLKQKHILEGIKSDYSDKKSTKFSEAVALDKKVYLKPTVRAYVLGSLSSLVFGTGLCMAMNVIFASFHPAIGIGVGVLGMLLCWLNYVLYRSTISKRKRKYQKEILSLCEEALLGE